MKATEYLKEEHEGIKTMLNVIQKIVNQIEIEKKFNIDHFEEILEFLKCFIDKCHHNKEEEILFPALEEEGISNVGGPIGIMLSEHQAGRRYVNDLSDTFDEHNKGNKKAIHGIVSLSKSYIQLMRNHIEKENNVLYMLADIVLRDENQNRMVELFEKHKAEVIGIRKHDEYKKLLSILKNIYL
jgi:hemerythrin-like domain-containing protein